MLTVFDLGLFVLLAAAFSCGIALGVVTGRLLRFFHK